MNEVKLLLTYIYSNNITVLDLNKTINDLKSPLLAKRDGAKWIVEYMGKYGDNFAGKQLEFEAPLEDSVRRMDVKDTTIADSPILYEFKSVQTVPPNKFNQQFIKDLSESSVTDLDQIKWVFDGGKSPVDFQANLTRAVEDLPLTDNIATKFGYPDKYELESAIIENFRTIFILVD